MYNTNSKLTITKKTYIIFAVIYLSFLILLLNINIITNNINAFKLLTGHKNAWFIYGGEDGKIVKVPGPNEPPPAIPVPDFSTVPIVTTNYWKIVLENLVRTFIIFFLIFIVLLVIRYLIQTFDILIKTESSFLYRFYLRKIRPHLIKPVRAVKSVINKAIFMLLNKKVVAGMILTYLLLNGNLFTILFNFILSTIAVFQTGPANWITLHVAAIINLAYQFLMSFEVINLFVLLVVIYLIIAFLNAYIGFNKNERNLEELVASLPFGVQIIGGSGTGKTATMQALASAGQRYAKRYIKDNWLIEIESAYGMHLNFNKVRKFYEDNKAKIKNSIDAKTYAELFIKLNEIPNVEIDRFLGKTPALHDRLVWYFIGLWIIDKNTILVLSQNPIIVNDPSVADAIEESPFDKMTKRTEVIMAKKFNQNTLKKSLSYIEVINNDDGTQQLQIKDGVDKSDINFSLEPAVQIAWAEIDKDLGFNERSEILREGTDDLVAILRHFIAFDSRTLGHFFYDSQARDAVANIIRSKFDFSLELFPPKRKDSLFFIPFIKFFENRLNFYTKIRKTIEASMPFKNSFFRQFLKWREYRNLRWLDYFTSFSFWEMKVRQLNSAGVEVSKPIKIRINISHIYNQYASVPYQDLYQEMKAKFAAYRYEHLNSWDDDLKLKMSDLKDLNSNFAYSIFGHKTEKELRREKEEKKKNKKNNKIAELFD